jgi:hypothetical protein
LDKKRKEKIFPIRGLENEKKRNFPSGDWIKKRKEISHPGGSERKRSERKNNSRSERIENVQRRDENS